MFKNNNTLGVENVNFTTAMLLGPIDNGDDLDFCTIDFQGKIASITTTGTPVGDSVVRVAVVGLPVIGKDLQANALFASHPLELGAIPLDKVDAWCADGLGGVTQNPVSTPPFHGSFIGATFSTNAFFQGWPFCNQVLAADDRWSMQFPVGRINPYGLMSISGYRKFWIAVKSVNPALVANQPSAMTITGDVYAHLYEFRPRR